MLREVTNGKLLEPPGGCLEFWNKYYNFQAGKIRLPQQGAWKEDFYKQIMSSQKIQPVKLGDYNNRTYWMFQNKFY